MGKFDKTCAICGRHYEYCTNCDRFLNYPTYMSMYCSKECVDLFGVLSEYAGGQVSKEDARSILKNIDQNKIKMLKSGNAIVYNEIMKEDSDSIKIDEEPKKQEPVKPEVEKQIAGDTVKKAVYDATRESGKNVPRSIAFKKKH